MFNFICVFIITLLFFGLTSYFFFNKATVVVILVMWYLIIASYILEFYLFSVTYDLGLATFAIFLLVITSVEAVWAILYVFRS